MAYEGPFSKRQLDNMVHIVETDLQFSSGGNVTDSTPIVLDATEDFSKNITARVTDNPVGDKSDRADNYRVYSPEISFSGVISNDLMVSLFGFGSATPVYDWSFSSENSTARCQEYIERLEKIFRDKIMVSIRMPDGLTTDNCLITSLDISRDLSWSNGFRISIKAKQVQVINLTIKTIPSSSTKNVVDDGKDGGTKTGRGFKEFDLTIPDVDPNASTLTKPVTGSVDGRALGG